MSGYYLPVSKWRPNFRPSIEEVNSTVVWATLPELPSEFFNKDILMRVGNCLGKATHIDDMTRTTQEAALPVFVLKST